MWARWISRRQPSLRHEVRVQARRQATRARCGGQEVEIVGCPSGRRQRAAHGGLADLERAAAEPIVQLVHRFPPIEGCGIEVEIAALDIAVPEET